jgi:hypothetical protein
MGQEGIPVYQVSSCYSSTLTYHGNVWFLLWSPTELLTGGKILFFLLVTISTRMLINYLNYLSNNCCVWGLFCSGKCQIR